MSNKKPINYYLRPEKCIERKMICEILKKLCNFDHFGNYKYIGFGAKYFTDFILFHRELGIADMISIEKHHEVIERYDFNKPYNFISIIPGESNDVLRNLDWEQEKKHIIWLDYENNINNDKLFDIKYCITKIPSGSVVFFTCNSSCGKMEERLDKLKEWCPGRVPIKTRNEDLDKNIHNMVRKLALDVIEEALIEKNLLSEVKYEFRQIIYYTYEDSAPMVTFGGVILSKEDIEKYDKCMFETVPFVSTQDSPFDIDVPSLTYKEIEEINRNLPIDRVEDAQLKFLPERPGDRIPYETLMDQINNYLKIYRYYPYYMETQAFN